MPVRPRHGTAGDGTLYRSVNVSLAALGALAVVGPRTLVVQSFVVPGPIFGLDALYKANARAVTTALPSRRGRCRCAPEGTGARSMVGPLRASMDGDDDDEFDANIYDEELSKYTEEDDMGMGVSNTIKGKKPARPSPEDIEGNANAILELAEAAQDAADRSLPDDEFDKYKRGGSKAELYKKKASNNNNDNLSPGPFAGSDWADEDGLGMGVSDTVVAPLQDAEGFGTGDVVDKAVAAMQGGDESREMEVMASKDMQRAKMVERGLSPEQIAAYMGDDLSVVPKSRGQIAAEKNLAAYQKAAFVDSNAWRAEDALLQVVPSSQLVKTDENGDPYQDRFVYVDEYTCIGCTHCSHTAPSTFFMEDEHGRARVYQQGRDTEEAVRDAIMTCPVDCIHYVDWPELKKLEVEREGIDINFKAKLVGNDHDNASNGQQLISGNQAMRCENCPSRGCYNCPMFGVGNNPEYTKRQAERKLKRDERRKKDEEDISGEIRTADL